MIPEKSTDTLESNLGGKKIAMKFADEATPFLMDALAKTLYSDAELAVLREYSTNAWDAHVDAGVTRPIEVTLPSHLSPFLKIRDFGTGLDEEGIESIYSQYGQSTKRETNEQTGFLGLGGKSAFAYTSQFTVTSVKDGKQIEVVTSRDEDATGSMTVSEPFETDEPSGTLITIPVKKFNTFQNKANNFFRFWKKGTVLVNGREPDRIDGLWLTDNIVVITGEQSYLVMGNIPYPVNGLAHGMNGRSVAVFVPLGAIDFATSREELRLSAKTKAYIEQVEADLREAVKGAVQMAVNKADSRPEALKAMLGWRTHLPKVALSQGAYTYKGRKIPIEHKAECLIVPVFSSRLKQADKEKVVPVNLWPTAVWVTGYDRATFTAGQKKKLTKWLEDSDLKRNDHRKFVLLREGKPPMQWIDKANVIDWATIDAIKLPRVKGNNAAGRIAGSFDVYIDGEATFEVIADEFDLKAPLYYFVGNHKGCRGMVDLLAKEIDTFTVVTFFSNRRDKFLRTFPKAIALEGAIQELADEWAKNVSEADKIAIHVQESYELSTLANFDPDKVDDPALKKGHEYAKRDVKAVIRDFRVFSSVGRSINLKVPYENPLKPYKLFDAYKFTYGSNRDHLYIYMNAYYKAMQDKENSK